jgi:trimethylamine---corrinoid protein Co-methyltransferase
VPARMAYLTDAEKAAIYESALELMATVGQRVLHPKAVELLRAAGAEVAGDLVKVPRGLVEKARRTAPAVIEVFDRAGVPTMSLGRTTTYFGSGSAVTNVYDLETGERRPTTLEDGVMAARLCDALPNVDFVMAYAHPGEVDPHVSLLESFRAMVQNTEKPLVVAAENARDLAVMTDIAEVLRGGPGELAAKPYFVVYDEPVSPLSHPVESVDKLLLCADRGVPLIYSPAPLAGGTAPITVAGAVAQGAAESLFGLVLHQVRAPGAPFIFGMGPAILDMGTMQSAYNAPEYLMGYVCAIELAKWLDLPNWGYAGTTDAQVIDAQAGMESAELTFLSLAVGSNLNHDLGYLDFGMTGSMELIVLTDEFIALNRKVLGGVEVTPETLAVDVVRDVGPGGDFLSHRSTAKQVRKAQWRPTVLNRQGRSRWLEEGGLDLREKARRKALRLLEEHRVAPLPAELGARVDELVAGFKPEA